MNSYTWPPTNGGAEQGRDREPQVGVAVVLRAAAELTASTMVSELISRTKLRHRRERDVEDLVGTGIVWRDDRGTACRWR